MNTWLQLINDGDLVRRHAESIEERETEIASGAPDYVREMLTERHDRIVLEMMARGLIETSTAA